MNAIELGLSLIRELQAKREGIPTFLFSSGFTHANVMKVRASLMGAPQGSEIDIILHSGGGNADDAYRLIRTFRSKYDTVNVIVPFWAKSAATIFAFGGTRIVLHEFGELGPLDAQIKRSDDDGLETGYASALNVQSSLQQIEDRARIGVIEMFRTVSANDDIRISKKQLFEMLLAQASQFYQPLLQKIDTMEIGSMARYLAIGSMYSKRILKEYTNITDEALAELLDFLVYGSPDHGYVVDYSILHQYLDCVIKANEEPFGEEYYRTLDQLSLLLMKEELSRVGFIDEFSPPDEKPLPKQKPGKINNEIKESNNGGSKSDSVTTKTKRTNSRPRKSTGAKKPRASKP